MKQFRIKKLDGYYTPQKRKFIFFWTDMTYSRVSEAEALKVIHNYSGKASYKKVKR